MISRAGGGLSKGSKAGLGLKPAAGWEDVDVLAAEVGGGRGAFGLLAREGEKRSWN